MEGSSSSLNRPRDGGALGAEDSPENRLVDRLWARLRTEIRENCCRGERENPVVFRGERRRDGPVAVINIGGDGGGCGGGGRAILRHGGDGREAPAQREMSEKTKEPPRKVFVSEAYMASIREQEAHRAENAWGQGASVPDEGSWERTEGSCVVVQSGMSPERPLPW